MSISTQPEFVQQGAPVFAGGFGNGFFQSYAGNIHSKMKMNIHLNKAMNFGISAFGYAVELGLSNWARSSSFPNGWYSDWEHKARIYTTKDLFYSLSLR